MAPSFLGLHLAAYSNFLSQTHTLEAIVDHKNRICFRTVGSRPVRRVGEDYQGRSRHEAVGNLTDGGQVQLPQPSNLWKMNDQPHVPA